MKKRFLNIIQKVFPFLLAIVLWRLSSRFFNPAGVLVMIPVFYCSFVKPVPWFPLFSFVLCFLLDYQFDTVLYWSSFYAFAYALYNVLAFLNLSKLKYNALLAFSIFFGVPVLILFFMHLTFSNFLWACWIVLWACFLYIIVTKLINKVSCND